MPYRLLRQSLLNFESWTAEAHRFLSDALLNDFVEADERAAANKQNFLSIDLNVFLVRMLAAALRRNITGAAFQNFEQRLLHAFTGNVARDANIVGLAPDLIDLVDVNDPDLGALHVVISILQQAQNDVLDIFADVAGFGQRRRVRDAKWNIENLRQRFGEQRFSRTGRPDEQDVALFDLHFGQWIRLKRGGSVSRRRARLQNAFEMIMDSDRERFLRGVLTDYVLIKRAPDIYRLRNADRRRLPPRIFIQLFIEDAFANIDATVANINARTGDQLSHLGVAFATEGTHRQVRGARHKFWPLKSSSYSSSFLGKAASAMAVERSGTAPSNSLISLRDLITSSTNP